METGVNVGRTSEWNEGTFKSVRLHDIQEKINFYKTDPTKISEGKFNYVWLYAEINNLYGEGYSKYSPKERKEVETLRDVIHRVISKLTLVRVVEKQNISGSEKVMLVDQERFENLMVLMSAFELRVKDLNDKHGLTTKNKSYEGLF